MRLSLLLWALLAIAPRATQANVADVDTVADLAQLEHLWNDAHGRGHAHALEALWTDGIVIIVPGVNPMDQASALFFARSGRMLFRRYETTDLRTRTVGGTAIGTDRLLRSRSLGATVRDDHWQFLKVSARFGERWRVIAFSASDAPTLQHTPSSACDRFEPS